MNEPHGHLANLLLALNQLVDALTGLERILTTPIPFSYVGLRSQMALHADYLTRYSFHLWTVTLIYCFFLASRRDFLTFCQPFTDIVTQPFQLWPTLKYVTIPGTIVAVCVCSTKEGAPHLTDLHKELRFLRLPRCRRGN